MRVVTLLVLALTLASCATREPSSERAAAPQAIEDGSFPGRSN